MPESIPLTPAQAHHGGSIWLKDADGWLLALNVAGLEWSMQFCADLEKVDFLRLNARRVVAGFPLTIPALEAMGYHGAQEILDTPITTPELLARYVDSLWNSCVPLPAIVHTGMLPKGAGSHHYPRPVSDAAYFKRDDWPLFVVDPASGQHVAVVPAGPDPQGKVQVVHAQAGTALHAAHHASEAAGQPHILDASNPIAKAAFADVAAPPGTT